MKSLFLRIYFGIVVSLFLGILFSEAFVNQANYEERLLEEYYDSIENINTYLSSELKFASNDELSPLLKKWQNLSGYDIELIGTHELVDKILEILPISPVEVESKVEEIYVLQADDVWVGFDSSFYKDRVLIISPHHTSDMWIAYSDIYWMTPLDFKIFMVNQLSLLLVFSLSLFIFLRPIVNTINEISKALMKFSDGQLDISVPEKGAEPLVLLSKQFNRMTNELKVRIEDQELMTGAMSHELKSPITRLRFALDMAAKSDDPEEIKELLDEMDIDLTDLDNLTTELLTLAKVVSNSKGWQYEKTNYRTLIELEANKLSKYEADISIDITGESSGIASPPHMSRVFSNVISNSLKYAKSKICITLKTKGDRCIIAVEDDGEGVSEQDLEKLFMPFFRVDSSRNRKTGGHGIGLSIVYNIIKHHQGEVQVKRSELGGLLVCISLPIQLSLQLI